jgi:hypothetical protein
MARSMAIREPLAVGGNVVYSRSQSNEIVGIDVASGKLFGRTPAKDLGAALPNPLTDRVYLVGTHGQLQCLRPIGGEVPKLVTAIVLEQKPKKENAPLTPTENAQPNESNPFEGTQPSDPLSAPDPFGAPPGETAPMADPFAPGN